MELEKIASTVGDFIWNVLVILIVVIIIAYLFYLFDTDSKPKDTTKNKPKNKPKDKNKDKKISKSDIKEYGIGGADKYLDIINKHVLSIRTLPKDLSEKLGVRPVKGIILHGPPGCGKTFIAKAIAKHLDTVEPIVISGPSIMSKWIGQSEENIRKIFYDAIDDQKRGSDNLHLVIFEEFDSIGAKRDSEHDPYGTRASIVNQLLSIMDGHDSLDNVIIIATTNRLETIDEALLRPGRFEVHIKIDLPDLNERLDILRVKSKKFIDQNYFHEDVNLEEIAELTENYTGADIEGLINKVFSELIERIHNNEKHLIYREDFIKNVKKKEIKEKEEKYLDFLNKLKF